MRIAIFSICLVTLTAGSSLAQVPVPAERVTPAMMAELKRDYPAAAYECFEKVLPEALASEFPYMFTYDFSMGQLWLISLAALDDAPAQPYICTPAGYAGTAQKILDVITARRMGIPN